MDFFDKLSQKAKETYQVAKEKTTDLSEEIKLKTKVNNLEEKNFEIFAEIGEIVYNEMQAGKDVEKDLITPKLEIITNNKNEMEKLRAQIREIKNIKKCVNCGAELSKDSGYCSKCGTAQPAEPKVEKTEPQNAKEAEVLEVNNVEDKKDE